MAAPDPYPATWAVLVIAALVGDSAAYLFDDDNPFRRALHIFARWCLLAAFALWGGG